MKRTTCTLCAVLVAVFYCNAQPLELYGIIGDHLVSVDKATGDATDIGTTCGFSGIRELTWLENLGKLYGIADPFTDPKIVCIDRNSGQATLVAYIDITSPTFVNVQLMEAFAYNPADGSTPEVRSGETASSPRAINFSTTAQNP